MMTIGKSLCFLALSLGCVTGYATADDQSEKSLVLQQSATIESLQTEVLRLNQELDGTVGAREELRAVMPAFERELSPQIARGDVQVALDSRGLVIRILDHALFDPDGSQFTSAGDVILKAVAGILSADLSMNRVSLEGHTDDQPIQGADGITNWEYSIARASAVLHSLVEAYDLLPERFSVVGYSEYRPVASNATEEGRDKNRRVEVIIFPKKISDEPGV